MLENQVRWLNDHGGMSWAAARARESSNRVYTWAESRDFATPFVADPQYRSTVVTTVDFHEDVDATAISSVLRTHGVVDVEPYRKLGRNQLRIATFTAVDPDDVSALLDCIDLVVNQL